MCPPPPYYRSSAAPESKTGATAARSVRVNRVCEMWVELTEQPRSLTTFEIFYFNINYTLL